MDKISSKYKPAEFESKWQKIWEKAGIYTPDIKNAQKPYYNLMMFPYPSAEGLHVGNMYAFTGADVFGRFMRMRGYDVFEPIGLDGFGIHSENYALKVGRHPEKQAKISEANFYRQLHATGNMFDWTRTVETYDPQYYQWTQWLFVQMFKHGLAYRAKAKVNWCPSCKTVLADEQVIDGKCERCSTVVENKDLLQWFFKITAYAERLLQNTYKATFKWPEKVKLGQRNWIGKKEGIVIHYPVIQASNDPISNKNKQYISVFTTRPDTNFGATFIVLAPEHPLALFLATPENYHKVKKYIERSKKISKDKRIVAGRQKTGIFTGSYAVNQLNGYQMPIWISDFVVMDVGTGAVVGVPGHDKRDFEFAQKFNIPIRRVVVGEDGDNSPITRIEQVYEGQGKMVNSEFLDGMDVQQAIPAMMEHLEKKGWGKRVVTYHLRDWLVSRQRYWGAPIPMIFCQSCAQAGVSWFNTEESKNMTVTSSGGAWGKLQRESIPLDSRVNPADDNAWAAGWYPVPEEQLPVVLPDIKDWKPTGTGRGPLAGCPEFYQTTCPGCGTSAVRETDVCDTFLDSSWYYIRYLNADVPSKKFKVQTKTKAEVMVSWDTKITKKWLPIDSYIGGAEHTVLHLLYTRFVWMALRDWGYLEVKTSRNNAYDADEPFKRFYAHGLIIKDGAKMSKSKGNVVVPDDYIRLYGCDTLRMYLMFLGPFDQGGDFRDTGIAGMYRWLSRVWRLVNNQSVKVEKASKGPAGFAPLTADTTIASLQIWHRTIKAVTEDLAGLRYNTAIAKLMELTNWWQDHEDEVNQDQVRDFLKLLAPFAPHISEELWQRLRIHDSGSQHKDKSIHVSNIINHKSFASIHLQPWPEYNPRLIIDDKITMVVQVNGKVRDQIVVEAQSANDKDQFKHLALKSAKVQKWLQNNKIKRVVFVPGKLINFVI